MTPVEIAWFRSQAVLGLGPVAHRWATTLFIAWAETGRTAHRRADMSMLRRVVAELAAAGVVADDGSTLVYLPPADQTEIRSRSDTDQIQIRLRSDPDQTEIRLRSDTDQIQIRPAATPLHASARVRSDLPDLLPDPDPDKIINALVPDGCQIARAHEAPAAATAEPIPAEVVEMVRGTRAEEETAAEPVGTAAEPVASIPTDRPPRSLAEALTWPIQQRALAVRTHAHGADWSEPGRWPEVIEVTGEYTEWVLDADPPRLGQYSRDSGVRAVVNLLADGYPVADLVRVCRLLPLSDWWRAQRRGLASLTPEVARRTLSDHPEPNATEAPAIRAHYAEVRRQARVEERERAAAALAAAPPPSPRAASPGQTPPPARALPPTPPEPSAAVAEERRPLPVIRMRSLPTSVPRRAVPSDDELARRQAASRAALADFARQNQNQNKSTGDA